MARSSRTNSRSSSSTSEDARVRADALLVSRGLFESREKARAAIAAGTVMADGAPVLRASSRLRADAELAATPAHPWVGRGALKLEAALEAWPVEVEGRVAADVGASTGGFTEFLLARGVRRVYAVDVGRGQLHARVRDDPRVIDLSPLDARSLTRAHMPEAPALVVCDVSFISLTKALPAALDLAAPCATLIALVKPQFELGPDAIGRGGRVLGGEVAAEAARDLVSDWLRAAGWDLLADMASPVLGGSGTREHLIWARRLGPSGGGPEG